MKGRMANLLGLAGFVAVLLIWGVALRPQAFGGSALYIVVRGDSMLPTYATGDLLILGPKDAYQVGDVVGYRVPDGELGEGLVVVHRIIGGDASDGFILKGDNNPAPDPWSPRAGDISGAPSVSVPAVGRLIAWIQQPVIAGALAASLMVTWLLARQPTQRAPSPSDR
jgi:signal peptidase I